MNSTLSPNWFNVFPGPRIGDVMQYVFDTWGELQGMHASAVTFDHDETELTDNLCEALEDSARRQRHRMDCDFQPETWEIRRQPDGSTLRVARADIRVILGAPGTPHLVMEFKKLDGTHNSRWRYCFDGMNRFLEGKYAEGHEFGVMCGFCPNDLNLEASALGQYISTGGAGDYCTRLSCVKDISGNVVVSPSELASPHVKFDTLHQRPAPATAIKLLHALMACHAPPAALTAPATPVLPMPKKRRASQRQTGKSTGRVST